MKKRMLKYIVMTMTTGLLMLAPLSAAAESASRVVSVAALPGELLFGFGFLSLLCIGAAAAYKAK